MVVPIETTSENDHPILGLGLAYVSIFVFKISQCKLGNKMNKSEK